MKVLDSHGRLQRTLAHELCHVAAWTFDRVAKPPHGKVHNTPTLLPTPFVGFCSCSVQEAACQVCPKLLLSLEASCCRVLLDTQTLTTRLYFRFDTQTLTTRLHFLNQPILSAVSC